MNKWLSEKGKALPCSKMPTNRCRKMMEILKKKKNTLANSYNNCFRKESSTDAKVTEYKFDEKQDIYIHSRYIPTRNLLQGENTVTLW